MYESGLTRINCPRCGLDIRLLSAELQLDRCPRCYMHEGVMVPVSGASSAPKRAELPSGPAGVGHLMVTSERHGEVIVLALHGRLDRGGEASLEQALGRAKGAVCTRVVIDLSALDGIDWSGLQLLLKARRETLERGHRISLLRGPRNVQWLLERSGAADLFAFED